MDSPWIGHGRSMNPTDCPRAVHGDHGQPMDTVRGQSTDSPWIGRGLAMASPLPARGQPCIAQGQAMGSPWAVHGLGTDSP
eukprot:3436751-Lingulodinium_polyedra.AAC.1